MIDALELELPGEIRLRSAYWRNRRRSRAGAFSRYEALLHDEVTVKTGQDGKPLHKREWFVLQNAIVHTGWGNRKLPCPKGHKLEFKRIRHLTGNDIRRLVREYFDVSEEQVGVLKVVRVDFAVDVGVPVRWFRDHAEVKYKQKSEQFPGWKVNGVRLVQGLQFGSHTDLYRIYDKTAQKNDVGEPLLYPGMGTGAPPPTVTRIERQCTGANVPREARTLGELMSNVLEYDPFERLILHDTEGTSTTDGWDAQKLIGCLGLRALVQEAGSVAAARKRLNELSGRKASRYFDQYSDLLNAPPGITRSSILQLYRQSTERQLFPWLKLGVSPENVLTL
jgi:hypothetical protein